jgi:hypothetical protein
MGIRPLSAASDLEAELENLLEEALESGGLDPDQIRNIANETTAEWFRQTDMVEQ